MDAERSDSGKLLLRMYEGSRADKLYSDSHSSFKKSSNDGLFSFVFPHSSFSVASAGLSQAKNMDTVL